VVVLAWICALFFALCGIGLVVAGFYAGGGGLVFGVAIGVFVAAGSIPFIRSARRMKKVLDSEPLDEDGRRSRRRTIQGILGFYALSCISALLLPLPGLVRVLIVIVTLLVAPLVLIGEVDKPKRR